MESRQNWIDTHYKVKLNPASLQWNIVWHLLHNRVWHLLQNWVTQAESDNYFEVESCTH